MAESQGPDSAAVLAAYQAATEMWGASEQTRWATLSNYLVASSVSVLAWAALYGTQGDSWTKNLVLAVLALVGIASGPCWSGLGRRQSALTADYAITARLLEARLRLTDPLDTKVVAAAARSSTPLEGGEGTEVEVDPSAEPLDLLGPANRSLVRRKEPGFSGLAGAATARNVVEWIPWGLSLIYVTLLVATIDLIVD